MNGILLRAPRRARLSYLPVRDATGARLGLCIRRGSRVVAEVLEDSYSGGFAVLDARTAVVIDRVTHLRDLRRLFADH